MSGGDVFLSGSTAACERAFAFLVAEYGFERTDTVFANHGFAIRYRGTALGVVVDWYPRDPLTVWLVRLADGRFPDPAGAPRCYFELGELLEARGEKRVARQGLDLPRAESARWAADRLRRCGDGLLRGGDLAELSALEEKVRPPGR
jgi:hypothetical protein